jgi:hypothetical protein
MGSAQQVTQLFAGGTVKVTSGRSIDDVERRCVFLDHGMPSIHSTPTLVDRFTAPSNRLAPVRRAGADLARAPPHSPDAPRMQHTASDRLASSSGERDRRSRRPR